MVPDDWLSCRVELELVQSFTDKLSLVEQELSEESESKAKNHSCLH